MVRKRAPKISAAQSSSATPSTKARNQNLGTTTAMSEQQALLGTGSSPALSQPHLNGDNIEEEQEGDTMDNLSKKSQWIVLAIASGACAAFNGVFAKLTTTELTASFATIANLIGLGKVENGVEVVIRAIFFALNLIFNGIMWTLFTKALARGTSTTQVSILNTSSNFMITAVLGFLIFSESLPPLWFLGAALLVAGNVIIGRRDEGETKSVDGQGEDGTRRTSGEEEEGLMVGEPVEFEDLEDDEDEDEGKRKERQEEDDILQLGLDSPEEQRRRDDFQLL